MSDADRDEPEREPAAPLPSGPGGPQDRAVEPETRLALPGAQRGGAAGAAPEAEPQWVAPVGRSRAPVIGVGSGRATAPAAPSASAVPAPAGLGAALPRSPLVLAAAALLGLAAVAAGLAVGGVSSQPVAGLALLFLLVGPGAGLAWALPGQELRLRLLVALLGGLAVDTVVAQAMLSLRWWSPRGGALAALLVTGALFALGALAGRTRRADPAADRVADRAATD